MSDSMFNNTGFRGSKEVNIKMHELYKIVRDRLEYLQDNFDPDAVCQNVCCEVEKKMGIYPNLKYKPDET
jgi:hypothetical protein